MTTAITERPVRKPRPAALILTPAAEARIASLTMGLWFLASSIGSYLGGRVAGLYDAWSLPQIFTALTAFAIVTALMLAALVRPLRRLQVR